MARQTVRHGACLLWTGSTRRGYPDAGLRGEHVAVHRWVLERKLGRVLAEGEEACHTCDTPTCLEPSHLFPGTNQDNKADCVSKARQAKGTKINTAKLTEADVIHMRRLAAEGFSGAELAERFGVHKSTALRCVSGAYWRHL